MTDKKVSEIIEKFEGVSTQAFEWSMQQQIYEGVIGIVIGVILFVVCAGFTYYVYNIAEWSEEPLDDGIDAVVWHIPILASLILALVAFIPSLLHLINTEYYALQALIG